MLSLTDVDSTSGTAGISHDMSKANIEKEKKIMMQALENMAQSEASLFGHLRAQVSSAQRVILCQQELKAGCERSLAMIAQNENVAAWALKEVRKLRRENELLRNKLGENPLDDGLLLDFLDQEKYRRSVHELRRTNSDPLRGDAATKRGSFLPLDSQPASDAESSSSSVPAIGIGLKGMLPNSPTLSDSESPHATWGAAPNSHDQKSRPPGVHAEIARGLPAVGNWVEKESEGRVVKPMPPPGSPSVMDMVVPSNGAAESPNSNTPEASPRRKASQESNDSAAFGGVLSNGTVHTVHDRGSLIFSEDGDNAGKRNSCVVTLPVPIRPGSQLHVPGTHLHGQKKNDESDLPSTAEEEYVSEENENRVSSVPDLPNPMQQGIDLTRVGTKLSMNSCVSDMRLSHDTAHFEVHMIWKRSKSSKVSKSLRQTLAHGQSRMSLKQQSLTRELGRGVSLVSATSVGMMSEAENDDPSWRNAYRRCCKKCIIHPNNTMRTIWDVLSLCLVGYDTITIPLEMFNPPQISFQRSMAWVTRIFWSFDMPLSFMTGFIRTNGSVELHFCLIAKRYITTWWILDVGLLVIDWLEVFFTMSKGVGFARVGKASRTFRVVRMMRLMRLLRITQILKGLTERIISDIFLIACDIFKSISVIMGLAHLCACAWYGIGSQDDEYSWVATMPNNFAQAHLGFRYAASLHWSLAQFSGGMDEIAPRNFDERIFAISIYLLAFVVAAIFVSGLTSSMTRLVIIGSHQSQQLATLRRYLFQQGISNTLCLRIQRNAAYALSERTKFVPEDKIDLLHFVSEPLKVELHFEIYSRVLRVHPFFLRYMEDCPQVMRKVCHFAIQTMQVSHNDVLFSLGEIPANPKVYFVKTGLLQYISLTGREVQVVPKMWACEAALWTNWIHRGQLTAITDCRLFALDCKKFQEIASSFEHNDFDPKKYAAEFVRDLNNCHQTDITDLPFEEELPCQQDARDTSHKDGHHSVVAHDAVEQVQLTRKSVVTPAAVAGGSDTAAPLGNAPAPLAVAASPVPSPSPSRRMSYLQDTALLNQKRKGSLGGSGASNARSSIRNSFNMMTGRKPAEPEKTQETSTGRKSVY